MSRLKNLPAAAAVVPEEIAVSSQAEVDKSETLPQFVAVAAPEVETRKAEPMKPKTVTVEVRARVAFADTLTQKNYKPGELVNGWNEARVAHYASRGLVEVQSVVGPSEFK